ncbi:hypothetical protein GQ457_09G016880 [Hibiscus cannabinus]
MNVVHVQYQKHELSLPRNRANRRRPIYELDPEIKRTGRELKQRARALMERRGNNGQGQRDEQEPPRQDPPTQHGEHFFLQSRRRPGGTKPCFHHPRISQILNTRPVGGFPSDTEVAKSATHEQCKAIATRSGKILEPKYKQRGTTAAQTKTSTVTNTPATADKPAKADEDHINPSHTKEARSITEASHPKKRRIGEFETVAATETCLALMHNKVSTKKTDPGSFTIECSIGQNYSTKALCEPGASIKLIRKEILNISLYEYISLFPPDFLILDREADENAPIILGRPFLALDIGRKTILLFLDGYSGFNQINIAPDDQSKTTFTCPYGTFVFRRMPFGLRNAPATFQRCMMAIFYDMNEDCLEIFLDDFSTFGDNFDSYLSNLEKVLTRCEESNLVLNWEKCHFMVDEGIVLDHKISSQGMEVDRAKIDVISKLPPPTTVKGICSFLGHAEFYRRFIENFSKITKPLCSLLEQGMQFEFDDVCTKAFEILKNKLVTTPIVALPYWTLPFELMCDASDYAVGAVLGQYKGKIFHPIYYASKILNDFQVNYTTTKKELLAVIFAFDKPGLTLQEPR